MLDLNSFTRFILTAILTLAMTLPMLIFYAIGVLGPTLVTDLKIDTGWLGILTMSTFGLASLLSLWAGTFVNNLGSRYSLAFLFWSTLLAYALMALLPDFVGLVVALLFCGFAQALANPVTNLIIAEAVEPRYKAGMVGIKQSGVQVSALFAGLCLPSLSLHFGWRGALFTIVPVALVLALLAPRLIAKQPAKNNRFSMMKPGKKLSLLMAIQLCVGMVLSSFITFLGVFASAQGASPVMIGYLIGLFGFMGIFSRVFLTPLGGKMRDESLLLLSLIGLSILVLLIVPLASPNRYWPLWLCAVGMGATVVATNAIAMSMLLRDKQFGAPAPSAGLLSCGFFAGFTVGPPLFGWLQSTQYHFSAGWIMLLSVLMLAGGLCLRLYTERKK
ncbi:MFS transporter [Salmonella enterica]|uniref:MFS transporter n=2 Tax=Salmonella enterica TaxID=28901 RepID=A0A619I167_SALER|nr:MFS transporter [Salmonella enterica]EBV8497071.1 MFS transporter [Salmonella enterica subsp. enterica serovar Java]ECJ2363421.1 MFS transporter [Salmonella enterica subsp. diarizonae]EAT8555819.1 MFS transporter [Salmonella enterica]EAV0849148.1 MFS transporter [Salmonella enterica]